MPRLSLSARHPRTRLTAVAGVGAIALLLPSAASAAPQFTAPSALSASSASVVTDPAVGVSRSGRVVVAWGQRAAGGPELVVRRTTAGGRFGTAQRVARGGFGPSAAIGPSGGAAVAWQRPGTGRSRRVEVAVARAGRGFCSPQLLGTARAAVSSLRVFATGGHYVAVWAQDLPSSGRRAVRFAMSDAQGRFGRARTVVDDASAQSEVSAAAGPDGTVLATWATPPHGPVNQQLVFSRLLPGAAAFGAPVVVRAAEPGGESHEMAAVGGPTGVALTWSELGSAGQSLRTTPVGPDGRVTPTTALTFAAGDRTVHSAGGPITAASGVGVPALAAWTVTDQTDDELNEVIGQHVFAAVSRPDGTYAPPVAVDAGRDTTLPAAGATASGSVLTWRVGKPAERPALRYAVVRADGTLGPGRTLARRASDGAVLASSGPAVVAVWKTLGPRAAGGLTRRRGLSVAVLRDR